MSASTPIPRRDSVGNYSRARFAEDLRMPGRFLDDCGIYTETVDDRVATAIPYRNTAGDVVWVEHRTSLEDGTCNLDLERGPFLYGCGLLPKAQTTGRIALVQRVEDVLALHLNGIPAVALGSVSWWPPAWTRILLRIPWLYVFLDLEANASLVRKLVHTPLRDTTYVYDLKGSEQFFEVHKADPTSVAAIWSIGQYEASSIVALPYWRLGREWYQP